MSDHNFPSEPTQPEDPWGPNADGPDLGARRRKSFDADGRAVRPGPSAPTPSPAPAPAPTPSPGQPPPPAEYPTSVPQPGPFAEPSAVVPPTWAQPGQAPPTPAQPPLAQQPWDQQPFGVQGNWQHQPGGYSPQQPGGWAPTPPGHKPFFQPGVGYFGSYPEPSQAGLALGLSIGGLASMLVCGLGLIMCPIGWFIGSKELCAIKDGRRNPSNQGTARAGQVIGIVGTGIILLSILGILLLVGLS